MIAWTLFSKDCTSWIPSDRYSKRIPPLLMLSVHVSVWSEESFWTSLRNFATRVVTCTDTANVSWWVLNCWQHPLVWACLIHRPPLSTVPTESEISLTSNFLSTSMWSLPVNCSTVSEALLNHSLMLISMRKLFQSLLWWSILQMTLSAQRCSQLKLDCSRL